jgi:hypothetical protein
LKRLSICFLLPITNLPGAYQAAVLDDHDNDTTHSAITLPNPPHCPDPSIAVIMSSMVAEEPHVPEQLVEQLAKGYDALSVEMGKAFEYQRQLENKLAWAKQQASF